MAQNHIPRHQISEVLEQAKHLHRKGKSEEANTVYLQILDDYPDNVEALRLRGVYCLENSQLARARRLLEKAHGIEPQNAAILNNLGSLEFTCEDFQAAVQRFSKALEHNPRLAAAANNLGNTHQQLGEFDRAIRAYEQALSVNPEFDVAWGNLANLMCRIGHRSSAINLFNKALTINPGNRDAWNNLGICYSNSNQPQKALYAYNKALELDPKYALALNNKGNLLLLWNQAGEALDCFKAAAAANDQVAEAWNGCGYAEKLLGHLQEATRYFKKSIDLRPDFAEAWNNLGLTFADQGQLDNALDAFRNALKIKPGYAECHSNLLLYMNYHAEIHERTLYDAHVNWAASHQNFPDDICFSPRQDFSQAIRLGFVSGDFCRHPVSYFLLPVLRNLSPDVFEITCYSNNPREDDLTAIIKKHSQHWRDISSLNDQEAVGQVRRDGIDVLFDLSGHTSRNRLMLFSMRAAPLQISWLGYPHTSGLDSIDCVLSDSICLPDFLHWQFSEKIGFMPNSRCCYEAPLYAPAVGPLPARENGYITFCSFNNPVKLNDKTVALWSNILQRCENSKLVLSWKTLQDRSIKNRITEMFAAFGIDQGRIEMLVGDRKHQQVFADYNAVDIALDTFPFSGGLTSCEALWMGVPVVTLAGKKPASRQTAGLLAEINLDELINFTPSDYADCAVSLALDTGRLANVRDSLRSRMLLSTLCDEEQFTVDFEQTVSRLFMKKQSELKTGQNA